jgi:hypothetical protein
MLQLKKAVRKASAGSINTFDSAMHWRHRLIEFLIHHHDFKVKCF